MGRWRDRPRLPAWVLVFDPAAWGTEDEWLSAGADWAEAAGLLREWLDLVFVPLLQVP